MSRIKGAALLKTQIWSVNPVRGIMWQWSWASVFHFAFRVSPWQFSKGLWHKKSALWSGDNFWLSSLLLILLSLSSCSSGAGPKTLGECFLAVSFSTVGEILMFYKGLGGKAVPPRKAFLLNRGLLHTNRHKLPCCLNRILAIITYPAGVSWVWCCLKLVACVLSCHLLSSSAFCSLV